MLLRLEQKMPFTTASLFRSHPADNPLVQPTPPPPTSREICDLALQQLSQVLANKMRGTSSVGPQTYELLCAQAKIVARVCNAEDQQRYRDRLSPFPALVGASWSDGERENLVNLLEYFEARVSYELSSAASVANP